MPCGYCDCLTIPVENPRNHERLVLGAKLADSRSHGHAEKHVCRLRLAAHESVAAGCPAPKLHHAGLDSVPYKERLGMGNYDRCAVGQGKNPEREPSDLRLTGLRNSQRPATRHELRKVQAATS